MGETAAERRKYVIGWLTFPPGAREDFMALALPYAAACRAQEGCLFFEMNPSATDPEVVVVTECFASAKAHAAHLGKPLFKAMWGELNRRCRHGRFENVFAGRVEADSAEYGEEDPAPVSY